MTNRLSQKHLKAHLAPTQAAAPTDFQWAAGFYEGEGYIRRAGRTESVSIPQKDLWSLEHMKSLFGGSISPRKIHTPAGKPSEINVWSVSGARARGFIQSIYGLLSPRRQEQAREALAVGEFK